MSDWSVDERERAAGRAPGAAEAAAAPVRADADEQINLLDLLIVIARYKLLIIAVPLLVGAYAVVKVLAQPNVYTASTKLLPPQHSQSMGTAALLSQIGTLVGVPAQAGARGSNELYIAMLKSRTVADNLIQRFDLMNAYQVKYVAEAHARLAAATKIATGKDGLITIEFTHEDPKRAAEFANAYVDELMKLTQVLAVTEAAQRRLFFERQLANAKVNLAKAEAAARQALAQRGLVKVDEQGRTMVETTARLRGQITVKEVQIGAMRAFATDENPELRLAQRELDVMRRELAKLEGDGIAASGGRTRASAQGIESLHLLRDVKYHEVVFEQLARHYEVAKLDEARDSSVVQVLDEAVPPEMRSGPKRTLTVLLHVLVAGVVAVFAAFVLEVLGRVRRDPRQSERLRLFRESLALWPSRRRSAEVRRDR